MCAILILLVVDGISLTQAQLCVQPPAGLVGWWAGDGNATDNTGNNPVGILMDNASFGPGVVSQAFMLDGTDDWVDLGSEIGDFGTSDFTINLWVRFNDLNGEQVIIEDFVSMPTAPGWSMSKHSDGRIFFGWAGLQQLNIPANVILPNTWYHIAVTRIGTTFTLYLDGVVQEIQSFNPNLESTANLKLGHRGTPDDTPGSINTGGYFLNGLLDEVEIYNRGLSATEIASIFSAGSMAKCPPMVESRDTIAYGETKSGSIDTPLFRDEYLISGLAGERMSVFLTGTIPSFFNPYMRIIGPDANQLADAAHVNSAALNVILPLDGQYIISVGEVADVVGQYGLHVQRTSELVGAVSIAYGETILDDLQPRGDLDWITLEGRTGDSLRIQMLPENAPLLNPRIILFDSTGVYLTDDARSPVAEILYSLPADGKYMIQAGESDRGHDGGYSLSVDVLTSRFILGTDTTALPGDSVSVPIILSPGRNAAAFAIELAYDPNILSALDVSFSAAVPATEFQTASFIESSGHISVAAFSTGNTTWISSDTVATVTFIVASDAAIGTITTLQLAQASTGDISGRDISTIVGNPQLVHIRGVTIEGNIEYYSAAGTSVAGPVPNIPVLLLDSVGDTVKVDTTNIEGRYQFFDVIPALDYIISPNLEDDPTRLGAALAPDDALRTLTGVVGLSPFVNPFQYNTSDVNDGGSVDATDALIIFQLATGQIANLRGFGLNDWGFGDSRYVLDSSNWPGLPEIVELHQLVADTSEINFIAGIYGDSNGNGFEAAMPINTRLSKHSLSDKSHSSVQLIVQVDSVRTVGDLLEFPILLNPNGHAVGAFEYELQYDSSKFNFVGFSYGPVLPDLSQWVLYETERSGDRFYMAGFKIDGSRNMSITQPGVLAYLRFTTTKDAPNGTEVELKFGPNTSVGNWAGEPLALVVEGGAISVGKENGKDYPLTLELHQNYPNPFNPETLITYTLSKFTHVHLVVYDLLGRKIATLVNGSQPGGSHSVTFDASELPSGIYFYQLEVGNKAQIRQMTFSK